MKKFGNAQSELDELNIKITQLQNSVDEIEEKLNVAEEKYQKQKAILEARLVAMY